tara:strand:- start:351 stop:1190 length:840 start_codon:yes stop_codon:yes gene_type:complete
MIKFLIINEIIKVFNKKRTYISFILITFLIPFVVWAISSGGSELEKKIYGQLIDSFIFIGSLINGYLSTYIIITILIAHMPFLATIVAAEIVSGEYSKSTFRLYLTRPVSRNLVLLSKLIIVVIYTTMMMFYFIFYTLFISVLWLGVGDLVVFHEGLLFLNYDDIIWRYFLSFFISNLVMITISCLCFFISTLSRNSVTPIIISISTVFIGTAISFIPIPIFEKINPYLFTGYFNSFLVSFYDPIPWAYLLEGFIVCLFWSSIFIFLSFISFSRKDIIE